MGFVQRRQGDVERKTPKFPRDGDMYHRYLSRCRVVPRASSLEGPSELQIWTWKGTPEEEEVIDDACLSSLCMVERRAHPFD